MRISWWPLILCACAELGPPAPVTQPPSSLTFADPGPGCREEWLHMPVLFFFAEGSAELDPPNLELVPEVVAMLEAREDIVLIRTEGHTGWCAEEPDATVLPEARAEAVRTALVAAGIPGERIRTAGYERPSRSACGCPAPDAPPTTNMDLRVEMSLLLCRPVDADAGP